MQVSFKANVITKMYFVSLIDRLCELQISLYQKGSKKRCVVTGVSFIICYEALKVMRDAAVSSRNLFLSRLWVNN